MAMVDEVRRTVLCRKFCGVILATYEVGIEPEFWAGGEVRRDH
jgi:hypothetical protein